MGRPSCASGFANCDGDANNGCETSLDSVANCGTCRNACPASGGAPVCSARSCNTTCNLSGTLALKVSFQVTWAGNTALAPGSGTVQFWSKFQGTHTGNTFSGNLVMCGLTLPDFVMNPGFGSEQYGLTFANASSFDRVPSGFPTTSAALTLSGASPGATLTLPSTALLIGLTLGSPTAAWPATAANVISTDPDVDGKPALTGTVKTGAAYSFLPVDLGRTVRSDQAYAAARLISSLNGTLTSCTRASGASNMTFDTHILGCRVQGGSRECTTAERDFVDGNRPAFNAGTASFTIVKVADAASCSQVRAAIP